MEPKLLQKLEKKTMTKQQLIQKVRQHPELIPEILGGVSSPKPAIRYGCAKVLMELSGEDPKKLYPHMDFFIHLLDSKYRILTWNALIIIANLTSVDTKKKFDAIFNHYYDYLNDDYMVTVANVIGQSGKIAVAKPYLTQRITEKLLTVEHLPTRPHLSEECKRVITEHAIKTFDEFFLQIQHKDNVVSFVKKQLNSPRETLRTESEKFLRKWDER